jgi:hypothetical protein
MIDSIMAAVAALAVAYLAVLGSVLVFMHAGKRGDKG